MAPSKKTVAAPAAEVAAPAPKPKAPRKPKASKVDDAVVLPPPVNAIDDGIEIPENIEETMVTPVKPIAEANTPPKAPRKPRAAKKLEPELVTELVQEATDIKPVVENNEAPKPKPRGRPKKVVTADAPDVNTADAEPTKSKKRTPKVDDDGNAIKRKKRTPKLDAEGNVVKRAPTAYILFISKMLSQLKEEYSTYEVRPSQKELMTEAAAKWKEHKEMLATVAA